MKAYWSVGVWPRYPPCGMSLGARRFPETGLSCQHRDKWHILVIGVHIVHGRDAEYHLLDVGKLLSISFCANWSSPLLITKSQLGPGSSLVSERNNYVSYMKLSQHHPRPLEPRCPRPARGPCIRSALHTRKGSYRLLWMCWTSPKPADRANSRTRGVATVL
jgi:hypothetical protein